MKNYTAIKDDPQAVFRYENSMYKSITGCSRKLFERFKGAICPASLHIKFLCSEAVKNKAKGGGTGRILQNRSDLKTALDIRFKGLQITQNKSKKEIVKCLQNIFPKYFEDL